LDQSAGVGYDRRIMSRLQRHLARLKMGPDLAFDALEGVVDGLGVAFELLRGRLVAMPVQIERQDAAL
jgi:hypothetical protein